MLLKVLEIPRGEVRPYAWVAAELGRPLAVRAVGNAVARNPIPFVIPCHRVVRSDGRIGNYGAGGPAAKRAVLESEGVDVDELERLPNRGVRFIGSDTTHIFCYPSCRNAKRVTDAHRVPLRSSDEARARRLSRVQGVPARRSAVPRRRRVDRAFAPQRSMRPADAAAVPANSVDGIGALRVAAIGWIAIVLAPARVSRRGAAALRFLALDPGPGAVHLPDRDPCRACSAASVATDRIRRGRVAGR